VELIVYTDGSCPGNKRSDNPTGTWAFVIVENDELVKGLVGSEFCTTNNRMELTAVIMSLEFLVECDSPVLIKTDSKYITDNLCYLEYWMKNDWKRSNRKPVLNVDLWKRLYELYPKFSNLRFQWVKGHGDDKWNNYVDRLARQV
jgi:ribonuclease HI